MRSVTELFLIFFCLAPAAFCSCSRPDASVDAFEFSNFVFDCRVGRMPTKADAADDVVRDLNVYAYSGGKLAGSVYFVYGEENAGASPGGLPCLSLASGVEYDFFALANCGRFDAPADECGMAALRIFPECAGTDVESSEMVLPMSCEGVFAVLAGKPCVNVTIPLKRLFARVDFVLDRSGLVRSDIVVTGMAVRQAAADVLPFSPSGCALTVNDGWTADGSDIEEFAGRGRVSFYVPENCRGRLLPGNTDHWAKVPENIPEGERGLCTYMEVSARYSSAGVLGENLVYRFYLGGDNCTDFTVARNTGYTVTLSLTDGGAFESSWKVDIGEYSDERELRFEDDTLVVWQGRVGRERLVCNPGDLDYELLPEGFEAAGLTWTEEPGALGFSSSYVGPEVRFARMFLTSWDALKRDTLVIRVDYVPGEFNEYRNLAPRYCRQWGTLEFPTASSGAPVAVSCGGTSFDVGAERPWAMSRRLSGGGSFYLRYSPDDPCRVYVMAESDGEIPEITLTKAMTRTTLSLPQALWPGYWAGDVRLTETGDRNYDDMTGEFFDADVRLGLCGVEGERLPLESFGTPDVFISADRLDDPDNYYDEKYDDFAYMFSWPLAFTLPGRCSENVGIKVLDKGFECVVDGCLARLRMWGLGACGDSPARVEVNVTNASVAGGVMNGTFGAQVLPTFPKWRWLGELENLQFAPGTLQRSVSPLSMGESSPVCGGTVTWEVRRGEFDLPVKPDESLWNSSSSCGGVDFTTSSVRWRYDEGDYARHAGAFVVRGSAVNPHDGRVVHGYYAFDAVMRLTFGAQVFLEGEGTGATRVHYSFSPFCEWAGYAHSSDWEGLSDIVGISCTRWTSTGDVPALVRPSVPEDSGPDDYSLAYYFGGQYVTDSSPWNTINRFLSPLAGTYFSFSFDVDGREYDSLAFRRGRFGEYFPSGEASARDRGACGFYELRPQFRVGSMPVGTAFGLENYLVEAAFGSYTEY